MDWRRFGAVELMWIVHTENVRDLAQQSPSRVRKYLTETGDIHMLRAWDAHRMSDNLAGGQHG